VNRIGDLLEVRVVARPVDRLLIIVERQPTTGRGVVSACRRPLDDKSVRADFLVPGQIESEHMSGDNSEKFRAQQRCRHLPEQFRGIHAHGVQFFRAVNVDGDAALPSLRELVEKVWDLPRDPGSHQHVVDSGQHRPERGRRGGHLYLLHVVDADDSLVAFLRQPHLDEVAKETQLLLRPRGGERQLRDGEVWLALRAAAREEVPRQHRPSHRLDRKVVKRAANVAVGIAILESPREHRVEADPRDHAQLPGPRYRTGELPGGDCHPHPTLNNKGQ
jgi:hypothetical protein